jgi:hypothetical protein
VCANPNHTLTHPHSSIQSFIFPPSREEFLQRLKDRRFDKVRWSRGLGVDETKEESSNHASSATPAVSAAAASSATPGSAAGGGANAHDAEEMADPDDEENIGEADEGDESFAATEEGEERRTRPKHKRMKNMLMLSKWLEDIPDDFEESWSFVVCPLAKRVLVVSGKGLTTVYRKNGKRLMCVRACLCVHARVCVCACVRVRRRGSICLARSSRSPLVLCAFSSHSLNSRARTHTHTHAHAHTHTHTHRLFVLLFTQHVRSGRSLRNSPVDLGSNERPVGMMLSSIACLTGVTVPPVMHFTKCLFVAPFFPLLTFYTPYLDFKTRFSCSFCAIHSLSLHFTHFIRSFHSLSSVHSIALFTSVNIQSPFILHACSTGHRVRSTSSMSCRGVRTTFGTLIWTFGISG